MLEQEHSHISRAVGSRVRELRQALGISQQDLADLAQLHATNLGKLERGRANPRLDTLARLAVALDTSIADIVRDVTPDDVVPKKRRVTAADLIRARNAELGGE